MSLLIGTTGCDLGTSYFLPRAAGLSVASELMLTGRFIDGERAERVGLVSRSFGSVTEMHAAAAALADEVAAAGSALQIELTKAGLAAGVEAAALEAALAVEDRQQALLAASPSMLAAFEARRKERAARRSKL